MTGLRGEVTSSHTCSSQPVADSPTTWRAAIAAWRNLHPLFRARSRDFAMVKCRVRALKSVLHAYALESRLDSASVAMRLAWIHNLLEVVLTGWHVKYMYTAGVHFRRRCRLHRRETVPRAACSEPIHELSEKGLPPRTCTRSFRKCSFEIVAYDCQHGRASFGGTAWCSAFGHTDNYQ